jgi:hypothetical protein
VHSCRGIVQGHGVERTRAGGVLTERHEVQTMPTTSVVDVLDRARAGAMLKCAVMTVTMVMCRGSRGGVRRHGRACYGLAEGLTRTAGPEGMLVVLPALRENGDHGCEPGRFGCRARRANTLCAWGRVVRMKGKGHSGTEVGQSRTAVGWIVCAMLWCRVRCTCTMFVLSSPPAVRACRQRPNLWPRVCVCARGPEHVFAAGVCPCGALLCVGKRDQAEAVLFACEDERAATNVVVRQRFRPRLRGCGPRARKGRCFGYRLRRRMPARAC